MRPVAQRHIQEEEQEAPAELLLPPSALIWRPRSGRDEGAPKASPSAPVRAWTAPSTRTPGTRTPRNARLHYDASTLHALNTRRDQPCYQATPKRTQGPFTCRNCRFSSIQPSTPPAREPNHLRCILLNTRSARKHAIELWDLLDSTAPDVAFLTETWLNATSAPDIAIAIPQGYKISRRDRTNGVGGGIAIIHKDSIKISTNTDDTLTTAEHMHFQIHTDPNTTLRGTLIYRPPGPRPQFSDTIADLISTHALASTDYILLGDLNFHLENNNDANSTALIDNLANLGLKQLVTTPTHAAGHTLDPIFSASPHVSFNHTTEPHWTDHRCVHFTFRKPTTHHRTQQLPRCCWGKVTGDQLTTALALRPPTNPTNPTDPDTAATNLTQWINDCANTLAPLKTFTTNHTNKKAAWFTEDLRISKHTCRKLEKKWLHDRTPDNHTALKSATRRHHQLIRTAKKTAFKDRLDNNAHNTKELFSIVKELSNPSSITNAIPPSQDLCDSLATFFHRKITDIHDSFNPDPPSPTTESTTPATTTRTSHLTAWSSVTDEDTIKTMNSIHSGSPSDPCPHHVFNKASATIAPHLRKTINCSFETATFPESWKHAEINALLKKPKADPKDLKNFRPISLLPFPAKVTEKIVNKQLTRYLEVNNILDPSQSGFRSNQSTETALIAATDDIRTLMDKGETAALILLDLSAAFDTVCHRTLSARLHDAGIQEKALAWTTSFLSGRTQSVRLPPFRSKTTEIICGVPQGSSLSPTLFNIYMAPLAHVARQHNLNIISYADDTQLIISLTEDRDTAKANLHRGMKAIADWMKDSRLKLNSDKTEVLILGPTPSAWDDSWWPTSLGTAPEPTDHARNLGVILDSTLSMTRQVNAISAPSSPTDSTTGTPSTQELQTSS
ncbi:hypothetical protein NDU88_002279 [Pleurodeles waltl]|uniref:Reverse transcriptase domain-containing protein n=1 Tax=Pleurodeles waltl TaxID=8319 RepID=A0AAV7WPI7_PLEWA|nr:hypothetical protein NDU88_002279 [Pleurodeles waltl]